jgi:hypothetical protein
MGRFSDAKAVNTTKAMYQEIPQRLCARIQPQGAASLKLLPLESGMEGAKYAGSR